MKIIWTAALIAAAAIFAVIFPAAFAFAQAAVVDPGNSAVTQWLIDSTSLVVTGSVPVLTIFVAKHLGISNTAALNGLLAGAASRAAGVAIHEIITSGVRLDAVTKNHPALLRAIAYVNAAFPDAIAKLGASPQQVSTMVLGEFGKLVAAPVQASYAKP